LEVPASGYRDFFWWDNNGSLLFRSLAELPRFNNAHSSSIYSSLFVTSSLNFHVSRLSSTMGYFTPSLENYDSIQQTRTSPMKDLIRQHGPLVWKTYWGVYFGTLGAVFLGTQSGLLDPVRFLHRKEASSAISTMNLVTNFFQSHTWLSPYSAWIQSSPWLANFIVAWLVAEACEPLRIGITSVLVPILSKSQLEDKLSST